MKRLRQLVLAGAALALLGGIFAMYGRADFLLTLANQLWGCF